MDPFIPHVKVDFKQQGENLSVHIAGELSTKHECVHKNPQILRELEFFAEFTQPAPSALSLGNFEKPPFCAGATQDCYCQLGRLYSHQSLPQGVSPLDLVIT